MKLNEKKRAPLQSFLSLKKKRNFVPIEFEKEFLPWSVKATPPNDVTYSATLWRHGATSLLLRKNGIASSSKIHRFIQIFCKSLYYIEKKNDEKYVCSSTIFLSFKQVPLKFEKNEKNYIMVFLLNLFSIFTKSGDYLEIFLLCHYIFLTICLNVKGVLGFIP